ncbi:TetR/AcrR family transcriptional regulator [Pediococcus claussenii]|uniref:Transcriptional regulator, TetR family n=1 Tax=Pediococcus claussenii (strain ATCC BAA-344 / DSM 14800 / JCM 18046 / KCTC 3811 / LMG 21948 / P06) TaxID=701521 RepID=G8PBU3_PEDCP|nr:TetR/AcrR family transcriptional regulator [Pediococcus claussenii]AEV96001.1 Transcriptional regulator, TetR family [Pediococcus claussenii ATCC BAA-344]ANZ69487.1 hypothetical protein AYR57_03810 [Pediococcus claussenii]ANZ71306.1 hypothetical protein AYR58_03825 [Pediococcus claussenii]KRN20607.1 hypothetical protein IV79_GL000666 [Pediococcus claussenii]
MGTQIKLKRTQMDLVRALWSLLNHKTLEKITIDDLCQEAMIHRSTFYRYYHSKYDLVRDMLAYMTFKHFKSNENIKDDRDIIQGLISLVTSDPVALRNITINNEYYDSYTTLVDIVSSIVQEELLESDHSDEALTDFPMFKSMVHSPNPVLAIHIFSGAILTVIVEWLKIENTSTKELNDMVHDVMCQFNIVEEEES